MDASTRRAIRTAGRIVLAHHPSCSTFSSDMVIRGRVCAGCAWTWPIFLGALAVLVVLHPRIDAWALLAGGIALGTPQVATIFVKTSTMARRAAKALGGLGLACAVWGTYQLPVPAGAKLGIVLAGLAAFGVLLGFRMARLMQVCRACPYRMDWENCAGMIGHGIAPDPADLGRR